MGQLVDIVHPTTGGLTCTNGLGADEIRVGRMLRSIVREEIESGHMQHQIDSATESLQQRMDEYLTRVRRLITGANVGGAIATLGFAGASLKFWETGAVPRPLFWTVVIFLFGLLLVMAATVIEGCQLSLRREAMRVAADHHDSWTDDVRRRYLALFDDARRWIGVELGVLVVAAIAAVAGAVLGLRQLWALTG